MLIVCAPVEDVAEKFTDHPDHRICLYIYLLRSRHLKVLSVCSVSESYK